MQRYSGIRHTQRLLAMVGFFARSAEYVVHYIFEGLGKNPPIDTLLEGVMGGAQEAGKPAPEVRRSLLLLGDMPRPHALDRGQRTLGPEPAVIGPGVAKVEILAK